MAQKVQTFLMDDFDGSEAEGTVLFGLDGTQYEIDGSTGIEFFQQMGQATVPGRGSRRLWLVMVTS